MKKRTFFLALAFLAVAVAVIAIPAFRFQTDLERVSSYRIQIEHAAKGEGLPPSLLAALVFAESRGHFDAVSSVEAFGLCQLLPSTAAEIAERLGLSPQADGGWSTSDNLQMGAHYLARVTRPYADDPEAVALGLLCYRLGPGATARAIQDEGGAAVWLKGLRQNKQSVWPYVDQVLHMQTVFAAHWSDS